MTKGITSEVAGDPDILLAPDLESGNILAKQLTFLAKADSAGLVLGARVPIILTSRADSVRARTASCGVAVRVAHERRSAAQRGAASEDPSLSRAGRLRARYGAIPGSWSPEEPPRVPGDHQLFVGRDHPRGNPASGLEIRGLAALAAAVQLDAEPRAGRADAPPDLGRVLAYAGGEHQAVDAAQHRRERPDLPGRAIDEILDCEQRGRLVLPRRSRMSLLIPEMPSSPDSR